MHTLFYVLQFTFFCKYIKTTKMEFLRTKPNKMKNKITIFICFKLLTRIAIRSMWGLGRCNKI